MPTSSIVPNEVVYLKESSGRRVTAQTAASAHLENESVAFVEIKVSDHGLLMGAVDLTIEELEDILAAALAERASRGRPLRRDVSVTERLQGRDV